MNVARGRGPVAPTVLRRPAPASARLARAVLATVLLAASHGGFAAPRDGAATTGGARAVLSADVRAVAAWALARGDATGRPFLVVDKRRATVAAFDADGTLRATTPALLGAARGDHSVPGIGERAIADIRPDERTTPAGRFDAELGRNDQGEDILWVDYDAAVSMHRVRAGRSADRRLARLASARTDDNRISYGCINVPAAFYDAHVHPLFAARNGIVYVLPETRALGDVFAGLQAPAGR